jgi:hypothetical protein
MKKNGSSALTVTYLPVESLTAYSNNARMHSRHQVRQIAGSIKTFGFTTPVLIDANNTIIAGHGRVAAAKLLGMKVVPTIRLESLTEEQIRAYVIADNRLAEKAGWDKSILAIEFQRLLTIDGDLDVTITGFEIPEIDLILEEASGKQRDEDDVFNVDETNQAVTQRGDLWQLGKHRILCSSSLEDASFKTLMAGRRAELVFVVPYNVAIDRHASKTAPRHREFAMAAGRNE